MSRSPRLASPLLLSVLSLTGCGAGPAVLVRQEVPPSLLACQAQPEPPAPPSDDATLALWIADLALAGDDCRSRLTAVRGLVGR